MITFEFEEKTYTVDDKAFKMDTIHLPDGRTLGVNGWSETNPHTPLSLEVIAQTKTEIANLGDIPVASAVE